jgi:signal peptidase I
VFNFFKKRQKLQTARELVHAARKMVRVNRDILDPRRATEVTGLCDNLQAEIKARNLLRVIELTGRLDTLIGKAFLRPKHAGLRENVEVFLVAGIVAMAVRTFFVQPFKIPTGSMQPTLYGVYPPRPPESRYEPPLPYSDGTPSLLEKAYSTLFLGRIYEPTGYRSRGDHIFVDKLTYHFRKPQRGEIIVFKTDHISDLPEPLRGRFYIKRLIGLPGDKVQIAPPYALINGEVLDERLAFARIYSLHNGYEGYSIPDPLTVQGAKYIRKPGDAYQVPADHFFVLGDNTNHSLDGRYWGSFPKDDLVGRATCIYWPFSGRFGFVE